MAPQLTDVRLGHKVVGGAAAAAKIHSLSYSQFQVRVSFYLSW